MLRRALRATASDPNSRKALRWILVILGAFLIGAIAVAALAGALFGFFYSSATSADQPAEGSSGKSD